MSSFNEIPINTTSSDFLVMRVVSSTDRSIVQCYCSFDQTLKEYLLCGSLYHTRDDSRTKNETNTYKFYCKTRKSLLSMLTSMIDDENILVELLNYKNLFNENKNIDYDLFNEKFKYRTVIRDADRKIVENPIVLTHYHFNYGCNDVDNIMERYSILLKNVR